MNERQETRLLIAWLALLALITGIHIYGPRHKAQAQHMQTANHLAASSIKLPPVNGALNK